jgi:hypothetical protein
VRLTAAPLDVQAQSGKTIELDWDIIAGASDGESALDVQMFDANGRDVQVPQTGGHNFFEFVTQVRTGQ